MRFNYSNLPFRYNKLRLPSVQIVVEPIVLKLIIALTAERYASRPFTDTQLADI